MHTNSNIRERTTPEGPNHAPTDSEGRDTSYSVDLADRQDLVAQRIEHPHFTGTCLLRVFLDVRCIKPSGSTSL